MRLRFEIDEKLSCELTLSSFDIVRYGKNQLFKIVEDKLGFEVLEMTMIPISFSGNEVTYLCTTTDYKEVS